MTLFFPTTQGRNLFAATLGAIAGLTLTPHHANEASLAAFAAVALLFALSRSKQSAPLTLTLCALLGLACTRLTVCLVS